MGLNLIKAKKTVNYLIISVLISSFLYLIFSVFIVSLHENIFTENYSNLEQKTIKNLLPQGWGFFTRNPLEDKYQIYYLSNNEKQPSSIKNSSLLNYFGLSRKARRYNYEFVKIYTSVPLKLWAKPETNDLSGLRFNNAYLVKFDSNTHFVMKKGNYIIARYAITPWAWANQLKQNKILSYTSVVIK